jgi:hypothetical protein
MILKEPRVQREGVMLQPSPKAGASLIRKKPGAGRAAKSGSRVAIVRK